MLSASGVGAELRIPVFASVAAGVCLAACSPYYSFLPKALTYEMETPRSDRGKPDPILIVSKDIGTILPQTTNARAISVGEPRKTNRGWAFCLTATVDTPKGAVPRTFWVTALFAGVYDRRPAEPDDQCELEQYKSVGS